MEVMLELYDGVMRAMLGVRVGLLHGDLTVRGSMLQLLFCSPSWFDMNWACSCQQLAAPLLSPCAHHNGTATYRHHRCSRSHHHDAADRNEQHEQELAGSCHAAGGWAQAGTGGCAEGLVQDAAGSCPAGGAVEQQAWDNMELQNNSGVFKR
jgi:hypothetical protein